MIVGTSKRQRITTVDDLITYISELSKDKDKLNDRLKKDSHLKKQWQLYNKIVADMKSNGRTSLEWAHLGTVTQLIHCRNTIGRSTSGHLVLDLETYNSISVLRRQRGAGGVEYVAVDTKDTLKTLRSTIERNGCSFIVGAGASTQVCYTH